MSTSERFLYWLLVGLLAAFVAAGTASQGIAGTIAGLATLQIHPARLLNDYTLAGGDGGAVVNASLVALIGLLLTRVNRVSLSGPTIAAVFTMFGFGLFGKTPLNALPIIAGVYLSAKIARRSFSEYILIALFGTALGPLVTLLAVETGLAPALGYPLAVLGGLGVGIVLPPVAIAMLRLHQGYNLYNIGLTGGFIALFAASALAGAGIELGAGELWNREPSLLLRFVAPAASLVLGLAGVLSGRRGAFSGFLRILRSPGRLPSDFVDVGTAGGTLLNMGIMGLAAWAYVAVVGAECSGPVLGGLFTIIGFAAFGKHPRNSWPIVAGVILAALLFRMELSSPGVILAALFCTTLAPLAGDFGFHVGVLAGFLHLLVVSRTGTWHSWIDLYNNGFAGGLTAALIVSVMEWLRANKKPRASRRAGVGD